MTDSRSWYQGKAQGFTSERRQTLKTNLTLLWDMTKVDNIYNFVGSRILQTSGSNSKGRITHGQQLNHRKN